MLNFGEAVRQFYKNYTNPEGRAQRSAFWWVQFYQSVMLLVFGIVIFMAEGGPSFYENLPKLLTPEEFPVLWGSLGFSGKVAGYCILAFSLVNFLPGIMLSIRRFHDLDRSGWWVLAFFIASNLPPTAILASFANIIWFMLQGTQGPNTYGPDPLGPNSNMRH
jgi:uncharacterized membrane protein YhaH (DUF805 family)